MNNFWKLRFGRIAEQKAVQHIKKLGYQIREKNFRSKFGEIDLIAEKNEDIIFIEVKAMSEFESFVPEDHFDWKKQRKQIFLAKHYLSIQNEEFYVRFDLVTVVKKDDDYFIEHYENVIEEA